MNTGGFFMTSTHKRSRAHRNKSMGMHTEPERRRGMEREPGIYCKINIGTKKPNRWAPFIWLKIALSFIYIRIIFFALFHLTLRIGIIKIPFEMTIPDFTFFLKRRSYGKKTQINRIKNIPFHLMYLFLYFNIGTNTWFVQRQKKCRALILIR